MPSHAKRTRWASCLWREQLPCHVSHCSRGRMTTGGMEMSGGVLLHIPWCPLATGKSQIPGLFQSAFWMWRAVTPVLLPLHPLRLHPRGHYSSVTRPWRNPIVRRWDYILRKWVNWNGAGIELNRAADFIWQRVWSLIRKMQRSRTLALAALWWQRGRSGGASMGRCKGSSLGSCTTRLPGQLPRLGFAPSSHQSRHPDAAGLCLLRLLSSSFPPDELLSWPPCVPQDISDIYFSSPSGDVKPCRSGAWE